MNLCFETEDERDRELMEFTKFMVGSQTSELRAFIASCSHMSGELERIVEHRQHRAGDEPDFLRLRGGGAEKDQRAGAVAAVVMKIMFDGSHIGEAELLREAGEIKRFRPIVFGGFDVRADRRKELDTEFH